MGKYDALIVVAIISAVTALVITGHGEVVWLLGVVFFLFLA